MASFRDHQLLIVFTFILILLFMCIVIIMHLSIKKEYRSAKNHLQALNQEKERTMQYVAMEIHDHFTQMLCLTRMCLHQIDDFAVPENKQEIKTASRYVDELILVSHNLTNSLFPENLKEIGLVGTIREEIYWMQQIKKCSIRLEVTGEECEQDPVTSLMIFRILQESLSNAIKYARASSILVALSFDRYGVGMRIQDDGIGFDPDANGSMEGHGMGLKNIRNRAAICGGRVEIQSRSGKGTRVVFQKCYSKHLINRAH